MDNCFHCGNEIKENEIRNGETRQFGDKLYHKICYKGLIDDEHDKIHHKFKIKTLIRKPRFIVAWWTPYFWLFMGMFFLIGNAVSLNFFKNIAIYNAEELVQLGSTNPPIVTWLAISTLVSMMMIVYGFWLFNHTEEEDDHEAKLKKKYKKRR
jgi:hypothetical protein